MLKIWGRASAPNVQKVLWTCEELGLVYDRIDLGGPYGGGDDPSYRALNPNGLVPTLEDGAFALWESHAIMRYLTARADSVLLYPDEARRRALVDQWLDWQGAHLAQVIRPLVGLLLRPGAPPPAEDQLAAARRQAEPLFEILDQRLAGAPFVAGEAFSLADIANAIAARRWTSLPIERPTLPALEDWLGRVCSRPAFGAMDAAVKAV